MLKQFGTFVAWLSGSVAGITAGLYALGFVATIGADDVLGIGSTINVRDPGFYIGRGGNLVLRTVIIGIWPVLLVLGVAAGLGALGPRLGFRRDPPGRLQRICRASGVPCAALAMFALSIAALALFIQPALAARDLLFAREVPPAACSAPNPLTMAVFAQDREALGRWFMGMAATAGAVVGLGLVARDRLVESAQGIWLSIAAIAGGLIMVELPIAYGVMGVEIAPPPVQISAASLERTDGLRFLARSHGGLLLWSEQERLVLWVSDGEVAHFKIGAGQPLSAARCAGDGTGGVGQ